MLRDLIPFDFKAKNKKNETVEVKSVSPDKKQEEINKIIDEIHESFYSEVDRLLASAQIEKTTDHINQNEIARATQLAKLGFTSSKTYEEKSKEIAKLNEIKEQQKEDKEVIKAIKYFSQRYPHYKFITEKSVRKICDKYGLIYGSVDKYIGTIPERNIDEMVNFKIDESDQCYQLNSSGWNTFLSKKEFDKKTNHGLDCYQYNSVSSTKYSKCLLEIAAPEKDFRIRHNQKIENNKIIDIPDPVVLQPVFYEGRKHYLVVTAWGQEASDPLVRNENMN